MHCTGCGAALPTGAKFCMECGTPAQSGCASCGAPLVSGAKFCMECGTPVQSAQPRAEPRPTPPSTTSVAERRVTSVLFGDLVGFTTLSESRDAEEVRELLSRYFAAVPHGDRALRRHRGEVHRRRGDGGLGGARRPRGRRGARGTRRARAGRRRSPPSVRRSAPPGWRMRVGVVTGEVAVTLGATGRGDGRRRRREHRRPRPVGRRARTGLGRRRDPLADVRRDRVRRRRRARAQGQGRADAPVAGAAPSSPRSAAASASTVSRHRSPAATASCVCVKELFHSTPRSPAGRGWSSSTATPASASRGSAWEFEKYVDGLTATVRWHRGRCLSYGDGVAFWALAEAVRARLGLAEADTAEVVAARLDDGAGAVRPRRRRARLAAAAARRALGLARAPATFATARTCSRPGPTFFERRQRGRRRGRSCVIDDVQYADDGLLDFLEHLLDTARSPLFVLALARPGAPRPDRASAPAGAATVGPPRAAGRRRDGPASSTGSWSGLPEDARDGLVARAEGHPAVRGRDRARPHRPTTR